MNYSKKFGEALQSAQIGDITSTISNINYCLSDDNKNIKQKEWCRLLLNPANVSLISDENLMWLHKLANNNNFLAQNTLGKWYTYNEEYDESIKYFKKCIDNKKYTIGMINLIAVYIIISEYDKAIILLKQIIEYKDEYEYTSIKILADIYFFVDNYQFAIELYHKYYKHFKLNKIKHSKLNNIENKIIYLGNKLNMSSYIIYELLK